MIIEKDNECKECLRLNRQKREYKRRRSLFEVNFIDEVEY